MPQPYVFISYASANRDRAERVARLLEGAGVPVWLDRMSIMGGTSWSAEIVRGIKGCAALVLLVSRQSVGSPNVQQEVQLAWENRRPLLPVVLEPCDLPDQVAYPLAGRQWVEVLDLPEEEWLPRALHALVLLGVAPAVGDAGAATAATVTAPAAARAAAPLTASAPARSTVRHNLPTQLSEFIGREKELEEILALVPTHRLVTLTGAGGVGKTRLALQAAAVLLDRFPDGVWLVDLASLSDPARAPHAAAAALEVRIDPDRPVTDTITQQLKERKALIIFDSCEHVIAAAAALAERLLNACPDLQVMATSREALGVFGEAIWRVPPLRAPEPGRLPLPAHMAEYDAVRLFINRVASVVHGFAVTYQNAPAIARICQRLEGIPLAIEMAAARAKVLTVDQIADRMDDVFRLLRAGSRTAPTRQQTLQALIDWSYNLLTEQEQTLWRRLSVFAGPFSMDAAEAICAGGAVEDWEVLDLLAALVDKSLVISHPVDDEARYRLLLPLRQYGAERLAASGAEAEVRGRHYDWCLQLAEQMDAHTPGPGEAQWLDQVDRDYDNIIAALQWIVGVGDPERALRLAVAMSGYWEHQGYTQDARQWLSSALALPGDAAEVLRKMAQGYRIHALGLEEQRASLALVRELVAWFEEAGDRAVLGRARHLLAGLLAVNGQWDEAATVMETAIEELRAGDNPYRLAAGLYMRAHIAAEMGKRDDAHEQYMEVWRYARALPPCPTVAGLLMGAYASHVAHGKLDVAEEIARYAFSMVADRRNDPMKGASASWLAAVALRKGQTREAAALARDALTYLWGDPRAHERNLTLAAIAILRVARAVVGEGDTDRVIRLLAAIEGPMGMGVAETVEQQYREEVASLVSATDSSHYQRLWAEGKAMTMGQAVEYAVQTV